VLASEKARLGIMVVLDAVAGASRQAPTTSQPTATFGAQPGAASQQARCEDTARFCHQWLLERPTKCRESTIEMGQVCRLSCGLCRV